MAGSGVPSIRPRAVRDRGESEVPTLVIAGLAFTVGVLSAWAGAASAAVVAVFGTALVCGGLYSLLAWLVGWPRARAWWMLL